MAEVLPDSGDAPTLDDDPEATAGTDDSRGLTPQLLYGGAALWALAMLASMTVYEWRQNGLNSFHLGLLGLIFTAGGGIGWLTAVPIARWLTLTRTEETRLAAYLLGLMLSTVSFTAFLFSMHYRIFYSRWHDPFGSIGWAYAFIETGAVAVYQFMVLGVPHYLPIAFPALLVAGARLAKTVR